MASNYRLNKFGILDALYFIKDGQSMIMELNIKGYYLQNHE